MLINSYSDPQYRLWKIMITNGIYASKKKTTSQVPMITSVSPPRVATTVSALPSQYVSRLSQVNLGVSPCKAVEIRRFFLN